MKKFYTTLGTMSGTSFDGIDLSIIRTNGKQLVSLEKDYYYPFDQKTKLLLKRFKKKIDSFNSNQISSSKSFKNLSRIITMIHAKAITQMISIYKKKIDIIGFHGITVFHNPKKKISLQLGNPDLLKQILKIDVAFNFRKNDINHGGQGAPLVPVYHKVLKKNINEKKPCLFINIGGISNFTYLSKNSIYASDIGPGNCLLDEWIFNNTGKNFDKNGSVSKKGKPDLNWINNFIDRLEYLKNNNNSFDTGDFNISELRGYNLSNGAATLSYLTAYLILNTIKKYKKINSVYFGGGGRKNLFLMSIIKRNAKVSIIDLDVKKINGDFIESQAFAYLAVRSLLKLPISFKTTTGVSKNISGGEIYKFKKI